MKRLLLPLLAALAFPASVSAESHWLILTYGLGYHNGGKALEKIEMASMEQCLESGKVWVSRDSSKYLKEINKTSYIYE